MIAAGNGAPIARFSPQKTKENCRLCPTFPQDKK